MIATVLRKAVNGQSCFSNRALVKAIEAPRRLEKCVSEPLTLASTRINSVQTRCIVKGEAQESPLFWRFSGGF